MDWMFQANPKRYDLLGRVSGHIDDDWSMNQHRDLVSIGDTIYFFISGQSAGVYVVGRVVGPVFEAEVPNEFGRWKVEVEYEATVDPPLLRPELLADPVLQTWAPFKGQLRTNFIMPPEVAEALKTKLSGRLTPIPRGPGEGFDETAHAANVAIAAHQAKVKAQMLEYLKLMPPGDFQSRRSRLPRARALLIDGRGAPVGRPKHPHCLTHTILSGGDVTSRYAPIWPSP